MNKILCILLAIIAVSLAPVTANARMPVSQPHNQVLNNLPAVGTIVSAANQVWVIHDGWYSGVQSTWGHRIYTDLTVWFRRTSDGAWRLITYTDRVG